MIRPNENLKISHKSVVILVCTVLFAFIFNAGATSAQIKKPFADSGEILAKLTFTSSISKSKEQINKELTEAIRMRGVEFVLLEEDEIPLRKAGANDLLIKAILKNITPEFKRKFKENLYSKFSSCQPENCFEKKKEGLKAAKQFLRLFGDSQEDKELVEYFKKNLPIIEKAIAEAEAEQSASERSQINNQKNLSTKSEKQRLKLNEIIKKLNQNSSAEDEQKLVKEICERGADFILNSENKKSLRDAGASDLLIKTIKDRSPDVHKEKERLYVLYVNNYDKDVEKRKIALKAGKEYLEKFENSECHQDDPLIPYFKENIPILEKQIDEIEGRDPHPKPHPYIPRSQILAERFNKAVDKKDWDEVFIVGAKLLEDKPEYALDLYIILSTMAYDQAVELKEKSKYDEKAIYYAELAINSIEKGETSENYGIKFRNKSYQYKTKDFPNGKENALGWMNYIIGYIKYFQQNRKDEAVEFLYKSTTYNSEAKSFPKIYTAIGEWYSGYALLSMPPMSRRITKKESLYFAEMRKQYSERAIDAYARAYNYADAESKPEILGRLKEIFNFRYGTHLNDENRIREIISTANNNLLPVPNLNK